MSPAIPGVTAPDAIRVLEKPGFGQVPKKGSHVKLANSEGRKVIVPPHSGRDIPRGTLASILRQAGVSVTEFVAHP